MTAFQAQQLGGMADVVVSFFNLLENIFALVGVARLLQAGELLDRAGAGFVTEGRQMLALDAQHSRIEDENALDEVPELPHVAGPVILRQSVQSLLADFDTRTAVLTAKFEEKLARKERNILLAIA